jgi:hypothetical protein
MNCSRYVPVAPPYDTMHSASAVSLYECIGVLEMLGVDVAKVSDHCDSERFR